jgi:hypothetical protein
LDDITHCDSPLVLIPAHLFEAVAIFVAFTQRAYNFKKTNIIGSKKWASFHKNSPIEIVRVVARCAPN